MSAARAGRVAITPRPPAARHQRRAAETHLSRLIERLEAGTEIVIARAGKPVARLVPVEQAPRRKRLGLLKGQIRIGAGVDAPLPDDLRNLFEGRGR